MSGNDLQLFSRWRGKRPQSAMTASGSEWRETLRDTGLMLSGIYQDLRGDLIDSFIDFGKWIKSGLRRLRTPRED